MVSMMSKWDYLEGRSMFTIASTSGRDVLVVANTHCPALKSSEPSQSLSLLSIHRVPISHVETLSAQHIRA